MTFQQIIQSNKIVVVDFFAEWCGPCKTMSPILQAVKKQIGDQAIILKIDVDKNPHTAQRFQIQGVPTLIIFNKEQIVWRKSGVVSASELVQAIQQQLP